MAKTIAQLASRNKREALAPTKRRVFDAQVNRLIKAGQLDSDAPLADRIHKVLLANRPGAASELPAPIKLEAAPAPTIQPLYDLLIAVKKYGFGSRTRDAENAPIVWLKQAGQEKRPPRDKSTTMAQVVKFLAGYELVATEVHQFEVIKKYRKVAR